MKSHYQWSPKPTDPILPAGNEYFWGMKLAIVSVAKTNPAEHSLIQCLL